MALAVRTDHSRLAKHYEERAEECRTIADNQRSVDGRAAWLMLAWQAQRLATWHMNRKESL